MCGIIGMVGPDSKKDIAIKMLQSLSHRGPDGKGIHQENNTIIGQTRLKIIDLITGDQPMPNEDKSIWIVYNGEIYNFLINKSLIKLFCAYNV